MNLVMSSNHKLSQFLSSLEQYCAHHGLNTGKWGGGAKSTPNLVEVLARSPKLLYVKESNIGEGFWGVNENQIEALEKSGHEWWLILLIGPGESAYVVSRQQVMDAIADCVWSRGQRDYKVHEGNELAGATKVAGYNDLFLSLFA